MKLVTALFAGLLFGFGLMICGMTNPAKVLSFLDLAGSWDPSLMLVMVAAIAVGALAFWLAGKCRLALLGDAFEVPASNLIDRQLVAGAALFGLGWGSAGFCPGPAVVAIGMGLPKALIFVAAMLAGMLVFEWIERRSGRQPE